MGDVQNARLKEKGGYFAGNSIFSIAKKLPILYILTADMSMT
jgi:hypothetical protein